MLELLLRLGCCAGLHQDSFDIIECVRVRQRPCGTTTRSSRSLTAWQCALHPSWWAHVDIQAQGNPTDTEAVL